MLRVICCTMFGLIACGPKVDLRSPFDDNDPSAGERTMPIESAPSTVASVISDMGVREGVIDRASLQAVLDAGPARVLEGFEVAHEEEHGKFVGWRLVRLLTAGARFAHLDLVAGDVLVTINRNPLVTPNDLYALWAELGAADEIVAELRRSGEPLMIRFRITPAALLH